MKLISSAGGRFAMLHVPMTDDPWMSIHVKQGPERHSVLFVSLLSSSVAIIHQLQPLNSGIKTKTVSGLI
jgi:hypothetical protein